MYVYSDPYRNCVNSHSMYEYICYYRVSGGAFLCHAFADRALRPNHSLFCSKPNLMVMLIPSTDSHSLLHPKIHTEKYKLLFHFRQTKN